MNQSRQLESIQSNSPQIKHPWGDFIIPKHSTYPPQFLMLANVDEWAVKFSWVGGGGQSLGMATWKMAMMIIILFREQIHFPLPWLTFNI